MHASKSKWLILLLFSIVLAWGVTACGGQADDPSPPVEPPTQAEAATPAQAENTLAAKSTPASDTAAGKTDAPPQAGPVTTVRQAAQLLDLRAGSLPEGAELVGQAEIGLLNYQTPLEVAAVVDYYRPHLADQGWQEDSASGYADDATAALYFSREGFWLSLSASKMSEGNTTVTLMQHGNVNLADLPQMADAEAGFAAPNTLIYFSPGSVGDVARFIRSELAALGWHEYSRPNSVSVDSADSQTRAFIQNGVELTAFISVAPAQDGKTSVQYSSSLLPLDLPIADPADNLEFDKAQLYLSYKTPAGLESLVEFYRQAWVELGWTELPDAAVIDTDEAALVFTNEREQLALALNVTQANGQSTVTLQAPDAAVLADSPAPTATETETEAESMPVVDLPDFPIPDKAQEIAYDPDTAELSFTSPSDVNMVVEFYRQALSQQGWQEDKDFAVVTDTFASVDFSQGDDRLTLTLFDLSGSTEATLDLSGVSSLAVSADTTAADAVTPPADAPTFTINDWPAPPEASDINLSGETLSYKIGWPLAEVAEYYRPTYELMELDTGCLDTAAEYTSMSCSLSNGNVSLNFFAFESFDNQTEVEISFTNYNYPVEAGDSGGPSPGDVSGELAAIDQAGLPLPDDNTGYSDESTEFSRRLTITSPSAAPALADFYQAELLAYGWELEEYQPAGDGATLIFTGTAGRLTVTLTPSGRETEIVLVNKNPTAAAEAGILPPAGQARLYLANLSDQALTVTINDQVINVAAGAGIDSPDTAPKVDLPPNTYRVTTTAGSSRVTDEITVGPDETWSLLLGPEGAAPVQVY
ncbi:MAG: hypothetical protein AB1801_10855 [Chloroflexota bacterium]